MCQAFSCLPGQGGVLAQDPYVMIGISMVMSAQATKAERERASKRGDGRSAFRRT